LCRLCLWCLPTATPRWSCWLGGARLCRLCLWCLPTATPRWSCWLGGARRCASTACPPWSRSRARCRRLGLLGGACGDVLCLAL